MAKEVYGSWVAVTGTSGEVANILNTEKVLRHHIIGIAYNGTNMTVLYRKG